jgi:hypothetical protein
MSAPRGLNRSDAAWTRLLPRGMVLAVLLSHQSACGVSAMISRPRRNSSISRARRYIARSLVILARARTRAAVAGRPDSRADKLGSESTGSR